MRTWKHHALKPKLLKKTAPKKEVTPVDYLAVSMTFILPSRLETWFAYLDFQNQGSICMLNNPLESKLNTTK